MTLQKIMVIIKQVSLRNNMVYIAKTIVAVDGLYPNREKEKSDINEVNSYSF